MENQPRWTPLRRPHASQSGCGAAPTSRSPFLRVGRPVVLDLSAVDLSQSAIAHLVTSLEQRNIRVLGFENVDAARLATSMPPLLTGGRHCMIAPSEPRKTEAKTEAKPEAKPKSASLVLH